MLGSHFHLFFPPLRPHSIHLCTSVLLRSCQLLLICQVYKLDILTEAGRIAGVPMYIGEWNEVSREEKINENGNLAFHIDPAKSNLNQVKADKLVNEFKKIGVWGMAFWNWNYVPNPSPNFNLIRVSDNGHIQTTKYFKMVEKAISS